jgi:hypothetical protein
VAREYLEWTVQELEQLFGENVSNRVVLAKLREELGFRKAHRAKQLLREVEGVLDGRIIVPKPKPRDTRHNQIDHGLGDD